MLNIASLFRTVFIDKFGGRETLHFESEDSLVSELTATYRSKAPIEIVYGDGSPIEREILFRIHHRLFSITQGPQSA